MVIDVLRRRSVGVRVFQRRKRFGDMLGTVVGRISALAHPSGLNRVSGRALQTSDRRAHHLIDALEIPAPALLLTILALRVPALFQAEFIHDV